VPASILHAAPRPKGQTPANWNPLRLQPQPFFNDKNRAFLDPPVGRLGRLFHPAHPVGHRERLRVELRAPHGLADRDRLFRHLLMAAAFRRLIRAQPIITWIGTVLIIAVAAAAFSIIEVSSHATFVSPGTVPEGIKFLSAILLTTVLLIAWAALYYSINFYILLEEQTDQLQRLEHQASSAQLAMLRYQLNPHFLFNTLNSISTLVLLRQTERANAMLSRLSSFLRYTLVNEPTGTVTMAQEVETLKLYLEIEKMRFEDRLRPHFEIEPSVERARLPSLLLQPLVENAIKYAVTPQEEGAEIAVEARRVIDRVLITVSTAALALIQRAAAPHPPASGWPTSATASPRPMARTTASNPKASSRRRTVRAAFAF
jgi:hypothetical protein